MALPLLALVLSGKKREFIHIENSKQYILESNWPRKNINPPWYVFQGNSRFANVYFYNIVLRFNQVFLQILFYLFFDSFLDLSKVINPPGYLEIPFQFSLFLWKNKCWLFEIESNRLNRAVLNLPHLKNCLFSSHQSHERSFPILFFSANQNRVQLNLVQANVNKAFGVRSLAILSNGVRSYFGAFSPVADLYMRDQWIFIRYWEYAF